MGREYKIKFVVPVPYEPVRLVRRLPRQAPSEIYDYAVEPDGFYFLDYLVDRGVAAIALQILLDEALSLSDSVEVIEP